MPPVRVLIVDDEPAVLDFVCKALQLRGYHTQAANSPMKALDLAENADPCFDLLVSDVIMPEMCGPELARKVVRICPKAAVLLMSAHITPEGLPEWAAFLGKPFRVSDLYGAVEKALASE